MTADDGARAGRSTIDADSPIEGGRPSTGRDHAPDDGSNADGTRAATDGGSATIGGDRSRVTVYRWSCPLCGESRTGMASGDENPRAKAEFSLRQHVQTSDGDGHGPANAYPPGFDPDAADRAVSVD